MSTHPFQVCRAWIKAYVEKHPEASVDTIARDSKAAGYGAHKSTIAQIRHEVRTGSSSCLSPQQQQAGTRSHSPSCSQCGSPGHWVSQCTVIPVPPPIPPDEGTKHMATTTTNPPKPPSAAPPAPSTSYVPTKAASPTSNMSYWTSGVFQVVGTAPYAEVMMITPPIAKAWLKLNKNNRKIQPYRVKIYMDAIRNGTWHAHGQGITFDVNRKLADGQHRLEAIVASNVAAPLTVFFNAKEEAVDGIDAGQERSHAQRMHMAFPQMVNATAVAAIARHIRVGTRTDGHVSKVPFSEVLETYEKYMPGVDFVKENIAGVRGFKRASVMAAISIAYCQNPQVIEALVKRAIDPTGHQHGDPALALRQYVMFQLPVKKETIRTQVSRVLRACKAAIQNEQLVQLKEYEGIWKFFGLDKPTE